MQTQTRQMIRRRCWTTAAWCLLLPALVFALAGCAGTRFYADVSATAFSESGAAPEATMESPLGEYALGAEYQGWYVEPLRHTSSIPMDEHGDGVTGWRIGRRWYFTARGTGRKSNGSDEYGWYDAQRADGCGP